MKNTSLVSIGRVNLDLPKRLTPLFTIVAMIAANCLSLNADTFRKSQIVDFPTDNLGGAGLEGWVGDQDLVRVTNGVGSLDGTTLGLVVSKGDRAFLSRSNLLDFGQDVSSSCRNIYASGNIFPTATETNIYISFLLEFQNASDVTNAAGGELLAQINKYNSGSTDRWAIWAKNVGGNIQLGVSQRDGAVQGTPSFASTNISAGQTVLVVAREYIDGVRNNTGDVISLWINPNPLTLGGDITNAPAPSVSITGGQEENTGSGPGRFYLVPGSNSEFDEFRVASTWEEATPSPLNCNTVVITDDPDDATVTEGINVALSVTATGTGPSFDWQLSVDSGANWSAVAGGLGQGTPNYTTPNLAIADSGNQYRCIASVDCDTSSATSAVATVTVNPAVVTPAGLIMDDTWADEDRTTGPITTNNSIWYASTADSLLFSAGFLFAQPAVSSSRLWVGYFTPNTNLPVSLAIGGTIKATWAFKADSITTATNGAMRIGLFDYADGGTRLTGDDFGSGSTGNGEQVRGYMVDLDFAQTFGDNPMDIRARTVLTSGSLLGSSGDYVQIDSGPAGLNGAPGLQNLTDYTLEMSVTRQAENSVDITTVVTGGGTNWTFTVTDNSYAYHRFDAFGIRPNSQETTAIDILFQQFKVEVTQVIQPFDITSIQRLSADSVELTWDAISGVSYQVQSRDLLGSGGWGTIATVPATSASQSYTNTGVSAIDTRYYRVVAP